MIGPVSVYEIKTVFHAPLDYAYAWCTDFTDVDRKLQGDPGARQLIRRNRRTVVYEDLNETPHGWMWSRQVVTLHPPNRWTATAEGNYRTWDLVYTLRPLRDGSTEFTMRGKRRATPLGVKNPSKAALEHELRTMWRNLGRALERDYRAGRPAAPR